MHQPSQVEHQVDDHQIKHDEDGRGAYLIHHLRHRQRIVVRLSTQAEEEQQETTRHQ